MIAYRDVVRELATADELARLRGLTNRRETEELLVGAGELEQGLIDALHPDLDVWDELQTRLRALVVAAASAHVHGDRDDALEQTRALLEQLGRDHLPATVTIKAPEGYLHYGIDPADYALAAAEYADVVGHDRAKRACVVGIRSIGTSLSAVVAAQLGSPHGLTVRPHGPPADRRVCADPRLRARVRELAADADVLIVDEGPGATGQTFACVATWLMSLGVEADRIVLLPHHPNGLSLAPDARRSWFAGVRKHLPPQRPDGPIAAAAALGLQLTDDLCAGRWRGLVPGGSALPCCPHHERRKHLARDGHGRVYVLRYAGRGRWGRDTIDRAAQQAALGIGPALYGAAAGFVALDWLAGRPPSRGEAVSSEFRSAVCAYLLARVGSFTTGQSADPSRLQAVLLENVCEVFGPNPPGLSAGLRRLATLPSVQATIPDARLQAHEWLRARGGYVKLDALDHGDGIRPPGPIDPAWDLAGAAVEHGLDGPTITALCLELARACERSPAALEAAVAAYRVPYVACCLGEMTLSAREAAAPADRKHLRRAADRYTHMLERELARTHGAA